MAASFSITRIHSRLLSIMQTELEDLRTWRDGN